MTSKQLPEPRVAISSEQLDTMHDQAMLLRTATSEANVIALGMIPAPDSEPACLTDIHEQYVAACGLINAQWHISNFRRSLARIPGDVVSFSADDEPAQDTYVRLTGSGVRAVSLGGSLMQMLDKHSIALRVMNPAPTQRDSMAKALPARNRLLVYQAFRDTTMPVRSRDLAHADTKGIMTLAIANTSLAQLSAAGLLRRLHRHNYHDWNEWVPIGPAKKLFEGFLDIAAAHHADDTQSIEAGWDYVEGLLSADSRREHLHALHQRAHETTGHARHGEAFTINDAIRKLPPELKPERPITTAEMAGLLKIPDLLSTKLMRAIGKLGEMALFERINPGDQPAYWMFRDELSSSGNNTL